MPSLLPNALRDRDTGASRRWISTPSMCDLCTGMKDSGVFLNRSHKEMAVDGVEKSHIGILQRRSAKGLVKKGLLFYMDGRYAASEGYLPVPCRFPKECRLRRTEARSTDSSDRGKESVLQVQVMRPFTSILERRPMSK